MAILCRPYGLLFIQAPRTGCTAIENLLLARFGGEHLPAADVLDGNGFIRLQRKHCSIAQLLRHGLLPDDYQTKLTTVTTVRNPFDSLVSLYVKKRETYHGERFLLNPDSWVHKVKGFVEDMEFCRTHTFDEWLQKRYPIGKLDRLLRRGRRSLYGRYAQGVRVVMRFERLQQDFEAVMRSVGADGDTTIPLINATQQRRASYRDYYTPEARQLVEYVFDRELKQYGYSFDGFDEAMVNVAAARAV
jgi:hypothetical protein